MNYVFSAFTLDSFKKCYVFDKPWSLDKGTVCHLRIHKCQVKEFFKQRERQTVEISYGSASEVGRLFLKLFYNAWSKRDQK